MPMPLVLFEDRHVRHLYPLALTRTAGDLVVGARTLIDVQRESFYANDGLVLWTRPEVAAVTAQEHPEVLVNELPAHSGGVLLVNQRWLLREGEVLDAVRAGASPGQPARAWRQGNAVVAAWLPEPPPDLFIRPVETLAPKGEAVDGVTLIRNLWDLIADLPARLAHDLDALGGFGIQDGSVHASAIVPEPREVHIGEDAAIHPGVILNTEDGPIWIGAEAVIEEGAIVRGPAYIGPKAVVKAAARVDTSAIGYWSKVGGEVHASIVHSLSSKAHDGYLGSSYLGRWCNLGADTNTSNLKNDYGEVTVYDAVAEDFVASGEQFVGLFMGDHSKCSINTMFNTGTVVGVFCNLFGSGFPPRHIAGFSWGGADGLTPYRLDKALRVAEAVMARRERALTEADRALLTALFAAR
ncbi:MAG: hypothetical protein HKN04_05575 [Rhodothermaceae bacterium]|nr:hypothetical protein [Rhodothermaceae bacterium]